MSGLYWREASWLWAALLPLLVPPLALALRRRQLTRMIDPPLLPWAVAPSGGATHWLRPLLLALAWGLLCLALAGPRTPRWVPPELRPAASSVVAIIDASASMRAADAHPDRLRRAIDALGQWLDRSRARPALGLVIFAGHAHPLLPPTDDEALLRHFLDQLGEVKLPTLGNALADALTTAAQMLQERDGERVVLLVSDGDIEPAARQRALDAIEATLRPQGIRLVAVGIGGPEKVALPAALATDVLGEQRAVLTRREAATLKQLATVGGGDYLPLEQAGDHGLDAIAGLPPPRIDPADAGRVLWQEWFGLPLAAALALLLLALGPLPWLPALVAVVVLLPPPAIASDAAQAMLDRGDYAGARSLFASERGYRARFGEGVACYRLEDWVCARQAFARAAWLADDDRERGRAAFNLGNAHFQLGEFEEAAVLFAQAKTLGVDAEAATRNLEFADDLAESLRKYRQHLEMVQRKADFLAQARDIPEGLLERMTEGIWLRLEQNRPGIIRELGREKVRALIRSGVARALGIAPKTAPAEATRWASNTTSQTPQSTAGLLNRLLPLEAGLGTPPAQPYHREGMRPW